MSELNKNGIVENNPDGSESDALNPEAEIKNKILTVDKEGVVKDTESSPELRRAAEMGLLNEVIFQEIDPDEYERGFDREVALYRSGEIGLGEMTPSFAHAMVMGDLKRARSEIGTFNDEMAAAHLWKKKLTELAEAFDLPEDHFEIDVSGPVLHVFPRKDKGENEEVKHPLHFDAGDDATQFVIEETPGFEAILPTHFQGSAYATAPHPEMHAHLSAAEAIPRLSIGKYVRIGGAWNPQGGVQWRFDDNCWIGQGAYFISQEHQADKPAMLARTPQHTTFPGMHVGEWAWVAKQAQILYRSGYIGRGSVVGSHAKVNSWVSDFSLQVASGLAAYYPIKAFVIDDLGINKAKDMLSLDWSKVQKLWRERYEEWIKNPRRAHTNVAEAVKELRDQKPARVLFLGSRNPSNVVFAASRENGANPLARIDVISDEESKANTALMQQALSGIRARNARFRKVEDLAETPLARFYPERPYDLVVVEVHAGCGEGSSERLDAVFKEAHRLAGEKGRVIGTLCGADTIEKESIELPQYIEYSEMREMDSDTIAVHSHLIAQGADIRTQE
jgi:acetyltransferase-like isoleucine patch superfamily enzyme